MAQFYKELKDLRISKEISLEDLESKTKINIKYLNAIEQGDFDILPHHTLDYSLELMLLKLEETLNAHLNN